MFFYFTLYKNLSGYYYNKFRNLPIDATKKEAFIEQLKVLNGLLAKDTDAAGAQVPIADIALMCTFKSIELMKVSFAEYPNVKRWFELFRDKHSLLPAEELTEPFRVLVDQNTNYGA